MQKKKEDAVIGVGEWATLRPVDPKHEVLPNGGVRFNVESVSGLIKSFTSILSAPPKREPIKNMAIRLRKLAQGEHHCYPFYPKLEASSVTEGELSYFCGTPPQNLSTGDCGLFWVIFTAFAEELPLILCPDDIWGAIVYAWQRHLNDGSNAE